MKNLFFYPFVGWMVLFTSVWIDFSQAMISFGYLSPEQAKETGLEVRYRAAGPRDVWVEVSFPTDDKWKAFAEQSQINYVQLYLENEDESLGLRSILRENRSTSGRVAVDFTVERAKLHQVSVWITRRIIDVADVVRMKDFIALEEIDRDYKIVPSSAVDKSKPPSAN